MDINLKILLILELYFFLPLFVGLVLFRAGINRRGSLFHEEIFQSFDQCLHGGEAKRKPLEEYG